MYSGYMSICPLVSALSMISEEPMFGFSVDLVALGPQRLRVELAEDELLGEVLVAERDRRLARARLPAAASTLLVAVLLLLLPQAATSARASATANASRDALMAWLSRGSSSLVGRSCRSVLGPGTACLDGGRSPTAARRVCARRPRGVTARWSSAEAARRRAGPARRRRSPRASTPASR